MWTRLWTKIETEDEYFLVIRTRASVIHVFMIQSAWTDIQTNSISVNAKLVTRGNNARKVRLAEHTSDIIGFAKKNSSKISYSNN